MLCVLMRIPDTIFNIKKKVTLNYTKSAAIGFCSKGLKKKFEIAVVNKPLVFEPLKFCYTCICMSQVGLID